MRYLTDDGLDDGLDDELIISGLGINRSGVANDLEGRCRREPRFDFDLRAVGGLRVTEGDGMEDVEDGGGRETRVAAETRGGELFSESEFPPPGEGAGARARMSWSW